MALINCPECGHSVSDIAAACPQCGAPIKDMIAAKNARDEMYRATVSYDLQKLNSYSKYTSYYVQYYECDKDRNYIPNVIDRFWRRLGREGDSGSISVLSTKKYYFELVLELKKENGTGLTVGYTTSISSFDTGAEYTLNSNGLSINIRRKW